MNYTFINSMTNFNQPLAEVYKSIHPINAKNQFVLYLTKHEKPILDTGDLLTLRICVQKLKKLFDWKRKQIAGLVSKANSERIASFIEEIKKDNRTMLIVKKVICTEIMKKLQNEYTAAELKNNSVYQSYAHYLKNINWIFSTETRIVEHITRSLEKSKTLKDKARILQITQPVILGKITSKALQTYAQGILSAWEVYYRFLLSRALPGTLHEAPPFAPKVEDIDVTLPAEHEELHHLEDEEEPFQPMEIPGFGAEDEAFINKLAEIENPGNIAKEISVLTTEKKEQVIAEVSFDPRFDGVYQEIISMNRDIGTFIGVLTRKVKEIEKVDGYYASEDFLGDLIMRIKAEMGANHLLVKKIKSFHNHLTTIHERSAKKLRALKARLAGQSIVNQVKILQETAKDKAYAGIFGTVRNLERIALEQHFNEIFGSLPVETQKIIGEGLLSDLKELKEYYPALLKQLEQKLAFIEGKTNASYVDTHTVDYALIDQILAGSPPVVKDSLQEIAKITGSIGAQKDTSDAFNALGQIMAGDKQHTPEQLLGALEKQPVQHEGIALVARIMGEILAIPDIDTKINTIRFWIDNHIYNSQPEAEIFLQSQLEALEMSKVREGGLLRRIFDNLESLAKLEAKTAFLKRMLDDPEYVHLKPILYNLISNARDDSNALKGHISEKFIIAELEKLDKSDDQLNWLTIRRELPVFAPFIGIINAHIKTIAERQNATAIEELEDKLTLRQAKDAVLQKQEQGEKLVACDNIITLARAVLKLADKITRRKYILEQEVLHPLTEHELFYKQRRLLFYLLNVEPGQDAASMVRALAHKMLLSVAGKIDYLKVLKMSRYKAGAEILSLQAELGIGDEDIAYYAADILAWDKQAPESKVAYFENLRDGKIRPDDVTFGDKSGEQVRKKYLEFFGIHFQIINKLIVSYRNRVKKVSKPVITLAEEIPGDLELPGSLPDSLEPLPEDSEAPPGDLPGEVHQPAPQAVQPDTETDQQAADAAKPGTNAYNVYMKKKEKIDTLVKTQLTAKALQQYREVEERMQAEITKVEKQYKDQAGAKIRTIITDLNSCKPEIISELINHTIVPALAEANDTTTMDLITILNQNLFTPLLYGGASLDPGVVVRNIESFLHAEGTFSSCYAELTELTEKIKAVREKYINTEVEKELHQITALNTATKSGNVDKILSALLNVEPALDIIGEMERVYINPLADNPRQKVLHDKLEFLKRLLITQKEIDWGKGEAIAGETKQLILKLKEKYHAATQSTITEHSGNSDTGKQFEPVEKELVGAKTFINPQLSLKHVLKEYKLAMSPEEIAQLTNKLVAERKIFSFDRKLYIGYGKLNAYLNDRGNVGYSRKQLAAELLKFLIEIPAIKDKAGFIGIPESAYDEFEKKMEYWAKHSDNVTAGHKPQNTGTRRPVPQVSAAGKKKTRPGNVPAPKRPQEKQPEKPQEKQPEKQPEKNKPKIAQRKAAETRDLLEKLRKMITDKLLFLIKESGTKTMLTMLYNSYLDPKARHKDLFVLLDKAKYGKLYDSIREDETLHEKLSFDTEAVKKAYNKKLAKFKK